MSAIEVLSRWKLKKINSDVPLYDPINKSYMVVIDNEPVDIPEEIYLKLFKQIEVPRDNKSIAFYGLKNEEEKEEESKISLKDITNNLKDTIRFYVKIGFDKENLIKLVQSQFNNEEDFKMIESEIRRLYDEIEKEN